MARSISTMRRKAKRAKAAARTITGPNTPTLGPAAWGAIAIGIAALGGVVFSMLRSDSFRIRWNPLLRDVGEFFGLTEEHGIDTKNITHDRMYRSTIRS